MNLGQLRSYLRRFLAEAGTARYDDALMNTELNRSARSLAGQLGLIQQAVTATTDVDGRAVVPGLVNVIGAARTGTGQAQLPIHSAGDVLRDPQGWSATGVPRALIVDEGYLGAGVVALWPVAAAATVTLLAFVDGGEMTADASIPWGGRYELYHDVIAYHAAHALMAHGGSGAAKDPSWWQRYQLRLDELRDRGSAGSLLTTTRMGSLLKSRRDYP